MDSRPRRPAGAAPDWRGGRACVFYNRPGGFRKGSDCSFAHVRAGAGQHDGSSSSRGPAAPAAGRATAQQHGRAPEQQANGESYFSRLLHELGCCIGPLQPAKCQQLVQLALRSCGDKRAARVLQALKGRDGSTFLTAVGLQAADTVRGGTWTSSCSSSVHAQRQIVQRGIPLAHSACTNTHNAVLPVCYRHLQPQLLLGVLVPVLTMLAHEEMRDPLHSNAVLAALHNALSLQQLAALLERISSGAAPGDAGALRQQLGSGGRVSCWTLSGAARRCVWQLCRGVCPQPWLRHCPSTAAALPMPYCCCCHCWSPAVLPGVDALPASRLAGRAGAAGLVPGGVRAALPQ